MNYKFCIGMQKENICPLRNFIPTCFSQNLVSPKDANQGNYGSKVNIKKNI